MSDDFSALAKALSRGDEGETRGERFMVRSAASVRVVVIAVLLVFVAIAHDDALTVGQLRLWLEDNTTIGRYSNFAVYLAV